MVWGPGGLEFADPRKWKGLGFLGGTPIRIPNHGAPNHQLAFKDRLIASGIPASKIGDLSDFGVGLGGCKLCGKHLLNTWKVEIFSGIFCAKQLVDHVISLFFIGRGNGWRSLRSGLIPRFDSEIISATATKAQPWVCQPIECYRMYIRGL